MIAIGDCFTEHSVQSGSFNGQINNSAHEQKTQNVNKK